MTDDSRPPARAHPTLRYAIAQWASSLASAGPASERAAKWREVIAGMQSGALHIGSRNPVEGAPTWITLDVVHGGFATGRFLAEGALQQHELEKLAMLTDDILLPPRARLNAFYLGPTGQSELDDALRSGCFRVGVPEEAALLVVTWLLEKNDAANAGALLEAIAPYFDRLRFYPQPHERALPIDAAGASVALVGEVVTRLRARHAKLSVEQQREAVTIWAPLYDEAVALLVETFSGALPTHTFDARGERGTRTLQGAWPCERFEDDWPERARALLDRYAALRVHHTLCGKPDDPRENFARLRSFIARYLSDPASITRGDKSVVRNILAGYFGKHGVPGSAQHAQARRTQRVHAARESHRAVAHALAERLQALPQDEGCSDVEAVLAQSKPPVSPSIQRTVLRCQTGTLGELVARGLVRSSETLASLLPAQTAATLTHAIDDERLRRIYWATYTAFRRRRSLLLVNLERQVKLRELPWVAALEPWLASDAQAAMQVLSDATKLVLHAFPQTLIPNPLVKELRVLATAAQLELPLVEELAADIFTGTFAPSFLRSAKAAARLLQGSFYERYFGIDYAQVLAMSDPDPEREPQPSAEFAALCHAMVHHAQGRSVAHNGQVIEQAQIVTSHNLAALVGALSLDPQREGFSALARRCFQWIHHHNLRPAIGREYLHNYKNCAYAWRQMIFFISLTDELTIADFVTWTASEHMAMAPQVHHTLGPFVRGLRLIQQGETFDAFGVSREAQRWLGWKADRLSP